MFSGETCDESQGNYYLYLIGNVTLADEIAIMKNLASTATTAIHMSNISNITNSTINSTIATNTTTLDPFLNMKTNFSCKFVIEDTSIIWCDDTLLTFIEIAYEIIWKNYTNRTNISEEILNMTLGELCPNSCEKCGKVFIYISFYFFVLRRIKQNRDERV